MAIPLDCLEVIRPKIIPGIAWPPIVEESDIDFELLVSMCRKRSLVRTAEKLAQRLSVNQRELGVNTPQLVPTEARPMLNKEPIALI